MSQSLSFSTDDRTAEQLQALAEATDRPRGWHLERALRLYLDMEARELEDIHAGLAEADAGEFATDEEMAELFASFREPPAGKRT